jgi:hypothetical protein
VTDALQTLLDKHALDHLIYSSMHAIDSGDWSNYRKGFAEDVEFDFTDHGVAPSETAKPMTGIDYVITIMRSVMDGFDAAQHHVTNMVHHLDGDTATTDCYVYAEHFLNNDRGDRSISLGGRYHVSSRRTDNGWQVTKWRFATSWFRGNPMLYQLAAEIAARQKQSSES